jgi:hypothetical protein
LALLQGQRAWHLWGVLEPTHTEQGNSQGRP